MLKKTDIKTFKPGKLLLSLTLALVLITPSFAVPTVARAATFKDINKHWAQAYIEKAVSKGLVKGFSDGTFKPDKPVTRAEFTAMANRMLGNTGYETLRFSDVSRTEWYYNDIAKALAATYVGGYNDGKFKPEDPASRQEAAIMISRFIPVAGTNGSISGFKDASTIANWASEAVGKVAARGYLNGYADGQFHPTDPITRAMLAKILCDISDKEAIVTTPITVSSNGTMLSNKIYSNGVTISSSLGNGNATLSNCVILGTLNINGGGENSVRLDDCRIANTVIRKSSSPVRVLATSHTTVAKASVAENSILETYALSGGLFGKGFENVTVERNAAATFKGNFPLVNVDGYQANVTLQSGTIEKLEASSSATDSKIKLESNARINTANVNARLAFTGDGYINELNAKASGITYTKKPGRIYTSNGASQPTEDLNADLEVSVSPKDKETSVSRNRDIELTFKDAIRTSSDRVVTESYINDNIHIRKDRKNGSTVDFTASISSNKRKITLDPRYNFDDDTTYYVVIDDKAFQYENGTKIREQVTSFYTGKDNKVGDAKFTPKDGASRVSRNVSPTIEFDDPIEFRNGSSIATNDLKLQEYIEFRKNNSSGAKVSFSASIDRYKKVITIEPNYRLDDGQKYYLAIQSGNFRFTKNSNSVRAASVTWVVGDNLSAPRVTIDPRDGASGVAPSSDIIITFDKEVYKNKNRDSINESYVKSYITIRHIEGNRDVDYNVRSLNSTRIVLDPRDNMLDGNSYQVTVSSAFVDRDSNSNSITRSKFKIAGNIDLDALNKAISAAEEARKDVKIADNPNKVLQGQKFVEQKVWYDFDTAIRTANSAKTTATSTFLANKAAETLNIATTAFIKAKKEGTKERLNDANFLKVIAKAKELLSTTQKSSDGLDCTPPQKWAPSEDWNDFKTKIDAAEAYSKKPENYTDTELTRQETLITNAKHDFENTKIKEGLKPDKTNLSDKIREARNLRDETVTSEDNGADVVKDPSKDHTYWATGAAKQALSTAIENAVTVRDNEKATKQMVDEQVNALDTAISTFKDARKQKE